MQHANNYTNPLSRTIICIGTSTGGPRALQHLLPLFPQKIGAAILIVQHMPPVFTKMLASRLNELSKLHVKEAQHGEIVEDDTVYIAPGGFHLTAEKINETLTMQLDTEAPLNGHRPSVDTLFQSIARLESSYIVAVLLTGMGSDGTQGLKKINEIHAKDVITIAEAESSCIIFGMPKAAIHEGVIDEVVALENIFKTIMEHLSRGIRP